MKIIAFCRFPLAGCVAAAALAACGGAGQPTGLPNGGIDVRHLNAHDRTFHYTGKAQSFVVPAGVTHVTVVASGASGPIVGGTYCQRPGGKGGLVQATVPVTPGESLAVFVGGQGDEGWGCDNSQFGDGNGGFNGGGNGGSGSFFYHGYYDNGFGDGGGGASDVRQGGSALSDRVVVAAGGGGCGGLCGKPFGGAGGGQIGGFGGGKAEPINCRGSGGRGGTQTRGGRGGRGAVHRNPGSAGTLGQGGAGGNALTSRGGGGGGAGGGYYGGGGGGSGDGYHAKQHCPGGGPGGGGGGGSSYAEPKATHVKDQKGAASPGNGQVTISW